MLENCIPEMLYGHMAVNIDHYIVVFGGRYTRDHIHIPLNLIWTYNSYTEQWIRLAIPHGHIVPGKRYCSCAVVIGSDVYMFGGYLLKEGRECNALWKLATDHAQGSFVWSEIDFTKKEKTPSPRHDHTGWEHAEKTVDVWWIWKFTSWISK